MALLGTSGSLALSQLVCHLLSSLYPDKKVQHSKTNSIKFCKFSFQGPFLLSCLVCSTPLGCCCMHCERPIICANSVALSLNDIGCNMVAACYGKETTPAD